MARDVIISDGRLQREELSASLVIPAGSGFSTVESGWNTENRTNGLHTQGLTEIVTTIDVTGTMPAGSEIVITPYLVKYGALAAVTEVLPSVTNGTIENRLQGGDSIRDADYVKITYKFQQGTEYTVTNLHTQVKENKNSVVTSVLAVLTSVFNTVSGALRVEEVDPISQHYVSETLENIVSATDGSYPYYTDMNGFRKWGAQIVGDIGATSGTLTITVEGTMQDDGTAPASCTFDDITNDTFGSASFIINTTAPDIVTLNANTEKLALYKYVKLLITAATSGGSDGSWTIYHTRLY